MGNEVKRQIKSQLDFFLRRYSQAHQKNRSPEETILLTGAPRSGTTWIYEILSALLNSSFGVWEPLNPRNYRILNRFDEPLRPYLNPGDKDQNLYRFFEALLKGQLYQTSTMERFDLQRFLRIARSSDPLIVKSVRGNRILPWLVEHFKLKNTWLLLRHPCAVISSQLNHGSWEYVKQPKNLKHPKIVRELLEELPRVRELVKKNLRPEEKLAVTWGFDYYVPLRFMHRNNYQLLFYEHVVRNGKDSLIPFCERLGVDYKNFHFDSLLNKKSFTTKKDEQGITNDPLSKWKFRLSKEQTERILTVVKAFGLDFYDIYPEPDMKKFEQIKQKFN